MTKVLDISNLSKSYGEFKLDGISFSLDRGYIMGLMGPNGAGKTTIIRLILSLIRPDDGKVTLFGRDAAGDDGRLKERIGFVFDESPWYGVLTVEQMTRIIAPLYRTWRKERFDAYLDRFGINPRKRIDDLSKGMKMKYSLAAALSHGAELVVMDEPTSGLDPVFRSECLEIFQDLVAREGTTILFSSHIVSDLEKIADYVAFVNEGRLEFSESIETIRDTYCLVRGGRELLDRDTLRFLTAVRVKNSHFTALGRCETDLRREFAEPLRNGSITLGKPSLEDIVVLTVKGERNAQPRV